MGTARGWLLLARMCSSAGAFSENSLLEGRIHPVRFFKFSLYLKYGCKGDGWCLNTVFLMI